MPNQRHVLIAMLFILFSLPAVSWAECHLNSTKDNCLGPAVYVFANYSYQQDGVLYFHKTIFHQADIRFDEHELLPWISNIAPEHPALKKALTLVQKQYVDLADRLNKVSQGRARILKEFGHNEYTAKKVGIMDQDERDLSAAGLSLAKVSNKFFPAIMPTLTVNGYSSFKDGILYVYDQQSVELAHVVWEQDILIVYDLQGEKQGSFKQQGDKIFAYDANHETLGYIVTQNGKAVFLSQI